MAEEGRRHVAVGISASWSSAAQVRHDLRPVQPAAVCAWHARHRVNGPEEIVLWSCFWHGRKFPIPVYCESTSGLCVQKGCLGPMLTLATLAH